MSKRRLIPLIVVADIAVLLVLLPFILDREKLAVDNEVRAEQAGSFAALSDGVAQNLRSSSSFQKGGKWLSVLLMELPLSVIHVPRHGNASGHEAHVVVC